MLGFQLQRLGLVMEPETGNPLEAEGVLKPVAAGGPDGQAYLIPRLVVRGSYSTSRWLEEALVPDARSGRTPAQMVDQKLRAVLGSHYRGIFQQLTGRPGDIRRMAGV